MTAREREATRGLRGVRLPGSEGGPKLVDNPSEDSTSGSRRLRRGWVVPRRGEAAERRPAAPAQFPFRRLGKAPTGLAEDGPATSSRRANGRRRSPGPRGEGCHGSASTGSRCSCGQDPDAQGHPTSRLPAYRPTSAIAARTRADHPRPYNSPSRSCCHGSRPRRRGCRRRRPSRWVPTVARRLVRR